MFALLAERLGDSRVRWKPRQNSQRNRDSVGEEGREEEASVWREGLEKQVTVFSRFRGCGGAAQMSGPEVCAFTLSLSHSVRGSQIPDLNVYFKF